MRSIIPEAPIFSVDDTSVSGAQADKRVRRLRCLTKAQYARDFGEPRQLLSVVFRSQLRL
jgi:hypothetical protein